MTRLYEVQLTAHHCNLVHAASASAPGGAWIRRFPSRELAEAFCDGFDRTACACGVVAIAEVDVVDNRLKEGIA